MSASQETPAVSVVPAVQIKYRAEPVAIALLLFGAWVSLRASFASWVPDTDVAVMVSLWKGISQHGLMFVRTWHYTPDNWLFSLLPLTVVVYSLFGTSADVAIGFGWGLFAASVAMTAYLTYRLAGRFPAYIVAVVLAFPNFSNIDGTGFLTYPICHNTSTLWALLTVILALRAVDQCSALGVIGAGACVFIAALSDPWASVAIGVPLVVVGALVATLNRKQAGALYAAALSFVAAMALVVTKTKLFGVLSFLPPSGFQLTDPAGLVGNVGWMFRVLAVIFNIAPTHHEHAVFDLIDFAAFSAILGAAITVTLRGFRGLPISQQLVCGLAIVSISAVVAAFILNKWDFGPGDYSYVGRFFTNVYYLGALLVVAAISRNWQTLRAPLKAVSLGYGVLLVVCGLYTNSEFWTGTLHKPASPAAMLGAFLEQNGLQYGYGPYWGTDALAMNWITQGRATVRPVLFQPGVIKQLPVETSDLWYSAKEEHSHGQSTFLVITDSDGSCPSVSSCIADANRQFGKPARQLSYRKWTVLVWNNPIVVPAIGH